jgi:UDP-N-acetylglucosamine--N-acetylmuramyl-(pentapeptide) pyrophosphoryl-undecaprenol N-acetylglucosamine transferase
MRNQSKKVIIATGGTGGHVFPAQALAKQLAQDPDYEILFMGNGLDHNKYFRKDLFAYKTIHSATPFRKNISKIFVSFFSLLKGIYQAVLWMRAFNPCLVIGFGSFHSFPVLAAAVLKKIPIILFESNSIPGKVNRFFSRWAVYSAVQFPKAKEKMKGRCIEVSMPFWKKEDMQAVSQTEARAYFSLRSDKLTFLVFGGSQGAVSINKIFVSALKNLNETHREVQVIHITGNEPSAEEMRRTYASQGIMACVKAFEDKMHFAWRASDIAVCRAGAASLAELLVFEIPGILIPYPHAADQHQLMNALFMQEEVGGAVCLTEKDLNAYELYQVIQRLLDPKSNRLQRMKEAMYQFKSLKQKQDLCKLVKESVHSLQRERFL